jgi:hypothetical protein
VSSATDDGDIFGVEGGKMKKRGFLVLALVTTTAGVASAFAPGAQDSATRASVQELAMPAATRQPAVLPAPTASESAVKKASFEVRQAPVPLLMRARPTIAAPIFDADAVGPEVPVLATDVSGESAAKAAIEADGYKSAKVLRKGPNGLWYAKALRGKTEVALTVDAEGHVALE